MAQQPRILDPAFRVPLNAVELHDLGVCAVVWGQIDFTLDHILAFAQEFDPDQVAMFLTDKPIGGKLDMLTKVTKRLPEDVQPMARDFGKRLRELKQRRNGAFHGVWGWQFDPRTKSLRVGAYHHSMVNNPVRPDDLRKLAQQMIDCSKSGFEAMNTLMGFESDKSCPKFIWGGDGEADSPAEALGLSKLRLRRGRSPRDRKTQVPPTPPTRDHD